MAALSPAVPDFFGSQGNAKFRVWYSPTFASGDTVTVPGIKQVFSVTNAKTGVVSYTSSAAANGLGVVLTLTVSASSTGNANPLMVVGY